VPELLVMRHAKSAWDTNDVDFDRPLAARGLRDRATMARWIHDRGLCPDKVLSSAAARARTTAQHVAETCQLPADQVVYDERLYHAGFRQWLSWLRAQTCERLLVCGHNPTLDHLVETLTADVVPLSASGKLMTTAAVAHLNFDGAWADFGPGDWALRDIARPREL